MRLPDESFRARLTGAAMLLAAAALTGCASGSEPVASIASGLPANGPQADYPQTVGDPYVVNGMTYTPVDTLNYDDVGVAILDPGAAPGVTAAHHTLPVPSYAEVTSLDTGRTILVRVERRGPMDSNALVALSPAALAQLEAGEGVSVRIRRVNPPEEHRYLLRAGQSAPLRMDTPMSLVQVLRRKAPQAYAAEPAEVAAPQTVEGSLAVLGAESVPQTIETVDPGESAAPEPVLESAPVEVAIAEAAPEPSRDPEHAPSTADGGFLVQAAAFSTQERATSAASTLDGFVMPSGKFWRVRTGPFATRAEAEASLAKVRDEGYTDARILTNG